MIYGVVNGANVVHIMSTDEHSYCGLSAIRSLYHRGKRVCKTCSSMYRKAERERIDTSSSKRGKYKSVRSHV